MSQEVFQKAYRKLNPRQKEAVDTLDGPVMVIAGPGTGKTEILTLRIANILQQTDTPPDAILALTFTESATANVRRRLVALIGSRGYYVRIHTFHGFCNRVIQEYPEHFPKIIGGRAASEVEQIAILRGIITEHHWQHLKPFGNQFFFIGDILRSIQYLKKEGLAAPDFVQTLEQDKAALAARPDLLHERGPHAGKMKREYQKRRKELEQNTELAAAYAAYQKELRRRDLYDYEDMILEVVEALTEQEDFRLELQEQHHYFLVDEHQDTNGAQNRVLELLASFYPNPNIFVVGDEKQAIYRFQGASLENFLYFQKRYPEAKLIYLAENYRSTQAILDSAQSLIRKNTATLDAPLKANRKESGERIVVATLRTAEAETWYVADAVESLLRTDMPPEEIAILYRDNRDAYPFADVFAKRGIPYQIESQQNLLEDVEIRKLITYLEAVDQPANDVKLTNVLHLDFLDVPPLDLYRLLTVREERQVPLYRLLARAAELAALDLEASERLQNVHRSLILLHRRSRNLNFLAFFEEATRESGFLNHLLSQPDAVAQLAKLSGLYQEIKRLVGNQGGYRLADFIEHLQILREHHVALSLKARSQPGRVRLMTAHRAKGLEFDAVFVVNAVDGHWGNRRSPSHFHLSVKTSFDTSKLEKNEDERRLFYMAMTRARRLVYVTNATESADGREQVPAQFIDEIRPELLDRQDTVGWQANFDLHPEQLFALHRPVPSRIEGAYSGAGLGPRDANRPADTERNFVRELFLGQGFSVTALNNYLSCPWKYFYLNLVRLPRAPSRPQVFGMAVHGALQRFFDARQSGQEAGSDFLLDGFRRELRRHPLTKADQELVLAKGEAILPRYYSAHSADWNYRTINEYQIRGVQLTPEIRLTGKLDKLELQPDPHAVVVVDYKVKQPESRNWIEGKTAGSSGDMKRQLIFYRLLLDKFTPHQSKHGAGLAQHQSKHGAGLAQHQSKHGAGLAQHQSKHGAGLA
ncbi:MAG: ATP-dependent helicase, partial [Candidatus Liptonbacteria bacterium]|nr:ATP-dependent helicase [Candidatus Liptonbacteria bacterium]